MELISHVAHVKMADGGKAGKLWRNLYHNTSDKRWRRSPVDTETGIQESLSNKRLRPDPWTKKAPIIGRVCMDQFMVDVTAIEDVEFGDKVVIFGRDGKEFLFC